MQLEPNEETGHMTWKKAGTKPVGKPTIAELSDDLMSQIAGGTGKMACHTRRTFSAVSLEARPLAAA
jgi:hypothetical protein